MVGFKVAACGFHPTRTYVVLRGKEEALAIPLSWLVNVVSFCLNSDSADEVEKVLHAAAGAAEIRPAV